MEPGIRRLNRRPAGRLLFSGVVLAFAGLVFVELLLLGSATEQKKMAAWVARTRDTLEAMDRILNQLSDAENARRGFVISGQDRYLGHRRTAIDRVQNALVEIRRLTADEPTQAAVWDRLDALIQTRLTISDSSIQARQQNGFDAAEQTRATEEGQQAMESIRTFVGDRMAEERIRLGERMKAQEASIRGAEGLAVLLSLVGIVVFGILCALLIRADRQRRRAENQLHDSNLDLDRRVQQRTTELSHLVTQLEEADEFRGRVMECAQFGLIALDREGRITLANGQFCRLAGCGPEEILGKSQDAFLSAGDAARLQVHVSRVLREGTPVSSVEADLVRRDGTVARVAMSWSPLLAHDGVRGAVGSILDITERRDSEQRLRAQLGRLDLLSRTTRAIGERQDIRSIVQVVLQSLEEHLSVDLACAFRFDPTARTLILMGVGQRSAAAATVLGITAEPAVHVGNNGLARCVAGNLVYEPDTTQSASDFLQRLARGGFRAVVIAPLSVHNDVLGVMVAARHRVASFSSGECEFLRQLSEHVGLAAHHARLYAALQSAYDDLRLTQQAVLQQERLRALGQMASGLAHDINNAIVPVAVYTELLLENETLSATGREQLKVIQRSISDVAQTVARMGEFYRQRETQNKFVPVDLNPLLSQVLEMTRVRWSDMPLRRGVVIHAGTELTEGLPPVDGIESELREALINLVFNAVDAMNEGGTLTLRTRLVETIRPGASNSLSHASPSASPSALAQIVVVEVQDTGAGMDEETRRRCLEPFFTTKGERGTGLGLAMVYGIAQRHHAELEIDTAPGSGTVVRLRFPPAQESTPAADNNRLDPEPRRALRILVIDDDPLVAATLEHALKADGHSVVVASGGQAGIETFLAHQAEGRAFELVITDLGMPHIDGRQVASTVKASDPETPVILLTGWGQRLDSEDDVPPHVDCVLGKPATLHQLRQALINVTPNPNPSTELPTA